jgi:hypothetical protein
VIGISIALNYIFIRLGYGIEGVALGTSLSYFLFFIIVSLYAARFFIDRKELLKIYFFIFLYFFYFLIGIYVIEKIEIGDNILKNFFLHILLLCIISLPVFVQLQRREKFFTSLWEAIAKRNNK